MMKMKSKSQKVLNKLLFSRLYSFSFFLWPAFIPRSLCYKSKPSVFLKIMVHYFKIYGHFSIIQRDFMFFFSSLCASSDYDDSLKMLLFFFFYS